MVLYNKKFNIIILFLILIHFITNLILKLLIDNISYIYTHPEDHKGWAGYGCTPGNAYGLGFTNLAISL